jgi:hypothetical protein
MRTTDDLREVIRAEFGRLDPVDPELTRHLEGCALGAVDGLDPEAGADVALAVVEGAHEFVAATQPAAGPTVGELSGRQLLVAALRPRRTTERGR